MLHRITGRAGKCGPAAVSAIAGVPTHEAAAVIRRLSGRRAIHGVSMDELAAALSALGHAPDRAIRHPRQGAGRLARNAAAWDILFADVPFELRAMTLGTFLDERPPGTWAIWASNHFVAWGGGLVADSGAWLSRHPAPWSRANPDHARVALRRVRIAVRFARTSRQTQHSRER